MEFGRDGQATMENVIKYIKALFAKTNSTIPEFIERRIRLNNELREKVYSNSYNPKTIKQRQRKKKDNNDSSIWNRGPNIKSKINFKQTADQVKSKFKISLADLIRSIHEYDHEFSFVTPSWFNSMYYDTAKHTLYTGQVYQVMKQIIKVKHRNWIKPANKSKCKKSKKSKKQ
eukprot:230239_1